MADMVYVTQASLQFIYFLLLYETFSYAFYAPESTGQYCNP